MVNRVEHRDGYVGGFDREVAVVTLAVSASGWRYERQVVWSAHEEGIAMS